MPGAVPAVDGAGFVWAPHLQKKRLTGTQRPSLLPFAPWLRVSLRPQEDFGETGWNQTQPPHLGADLVGVRAGPPASLAPRPGLLQLAKATVTQPNRSQGAAQTGKDQKWPAMQRPSATVASLGTRKYLSCS